MSNECKEYEQRACCCHSLIDAVHENNEAVSTQEATATPLRQLVRPEFPFPDLV